MLEIILLKVMHEGLGAAKKLQKYIAECDVYGPEAAAMTEVVAIGTEEDWQRMLASGSRTSVKKMVETASANEPPEQQVFRLREYDDIFRSKKTIWHVERFSSKDADELRRVYTAADMSAKAGLVSLVKGDIDDFLGKYWNACRLMYQVQDKRDRHIAVNLSCAEELLRKQFEHLRSKEFLRYTLALGSLHCPEVYTSAKVISILLTEGDFQDKIEFAVDPKRPYEEQKLELLRAGVLKATNIFYKLSAADIYGMGLDELTSLVKARAMR